MKVRLLIFIIVVTLVSGKALSQDQFSELLNKDDAVSMMLENNFSVKIARNNVSIAENNAGILNSGYLPTVFGLAGGSYDNTTSTTDFNGALDNEGNPRPDITIEDAETRRLNASINLDYTLFDGLGRYYNYKSLKEQYQLSELQARQTIEETAVQMLVVYYDVARLSENVNVLETALEISKQREVRAQYQFDYGQVRKLDVLNAKVDVNTDSINLLNARQLLINAKRDLNLLLNRDLETTFRVDTTVTFINELELEEYVRAVEGNNVSLLQAEKNLEISEFSLKRNKGLLLPMVGLSGSYGWNRTENPASAFFPGTTGTSTALNVGLNLRWNLFDGGNAYTAIRNSRISIENQEFAKSQFQQQVYRDIANARGDYTNALYIYRLQEQNVITNNDNFERSREQLKLGQITSLEFRQAQVNLLNAQTTRNAAKYNAKAAEARLLQLVGQLLNVPL